MTQRVFVLDQEKRPLMPCHPARARELLRKGKAAVFRHQPFTLILKGRVGGGTQAAALKIDPGSQTTGLAVVTDEVAGKALAWGAELDHRGKQVKTGLDQRRGVRRSRRARKTRYRQPRFLNRRRRTGKLPPSVESRVENVTTWVERLRRLCPITTIAVEVVKFDPQALQNPEISGIEYQQGTLFGYEVREYLLEKWQRQCAYCGATNVALEIEHIVPVSRGGSDRVSNLTLACHADNLVKGTRTAAEFGFPHLHALAQQPLTDAAAVNAARWKLFEALKATGLPLEASSGGRTKFNRVWQGYPKAHWIDVACVGVSGEKVYIHPCHIPLRIKATGRQSRQMCRMNQFGFPRTRAKAWSVVHGFRTGDVVRARVPSGKHVGRHIGRVAVRQTGKFRVGTRDGISFKHCHVIQRADGYEYEKGGEAHSSPG